MKSSILKRSIIILLAAILQIILFSFLFTDLFRSIEHIEAILAFISLIIGLTIIRSELIGNFKIAWIILIFIFPVFAVILIFLLQRDRKKLKKNIMENAHKYERKYKLYDTSHLNYHERQVQLLNHHAHYNVCENNETEYYEIGEKFFRQLIIDLKKAKRYIFIQSFIINTGEMWGSILEILIEKAKTGVEVKVMYDDIGCFATLDPKYPEFLESKGIETQIFNPVKPVINTNVNNRDHRKIIVIDGEIAFNGGINIADEYINAIVKYGHWKDMGIKVTGDSAFEFAKIFLETWSFSRNVSVDVEKYKGNVETYNISNGLCIPFSSNPIDEDNLAVDLLLNIINNARKYIYITTPYLIIDDMMQNALINAVKSGVKIKIITPHIWDKKAVHMLTRSNYKRLCNYGIEIYEYTPGFIHGKTLVSDDKIAVVGSINLDYRSLFHHFECGTWMYETNSVKEVKEDFINTLKISKEITQEDYNKSFIYNFFIDLLYLFAPLM
ncbi:cardiolipin synthase [Fusobacterium sp. MFO224]|uniref:cardiolipin synthase n=1 Tax=Fusobacterium sp. MFO224 TaxID=3378070 RepID=UPI003852C87E